MSVNDLADIFEDAAREALAKAKAINVCEFHPDVTIRVGDLDTERHAYALATTILKSKGEMFLREDVMAAIKGCLDLAADDGCPKCAYLRDK